MVSAEIIHDAESLVGQFRSEVAALLVDDLTRVNAVRREICRLDGDDPMSENAAALLAGTATGGSTLLTLASSAEPRQGTCDFHHRVWCRRARGGSSADGDCASARDGNRLSLAHRFGQTSIKAGQDSRAKDCRVGNPL